MAKMKGFGGLGKIFGVEPPPEKKSQSQSGNSQSQNNSSSRSGNYQRQNNSSQSKNFQSGSASAPYNFVSLPEKILPAPSDEKNISGEISLKITAKTPLFIGNGNDPKSFAPVGTPIIPGSSLRGMFKNIFKVVTCGAFRGQKDFNDEHIYFRCLMAPNGLPDWMKDLHAHYEKLMTDPANKRKKARPGFLIQRDGKYFIAKAIDPETGKTYMNDCTNDYILIKNFQKRFGKVEFRDSRVEWHENIAYCVTGNQWAKKPERLLDAVAYEKYKNELAILNARRKSKEITESQYQREVRRIGHGKQIIRFTKLDYVDWYGDWFEISDEVLSSYRHDRNRKGVNLLDKKWILTREQLAAKLRRCGKTVPQGVQSLVPCHFLTDGDKVTAFGHGRCFRVPYKQSIGEAVPKKLRDTNVLDFADAVFGCAEICAGRVYFDDATPVDETVHELKTSQAHLLMPPNPTSYQLYLTQNPKSDKLTFWDEKDGHVPKIRGYKFYWHNADYDWQVGKKELDNDAKRDGESLIKKMTPLDKGSKFEAKIRFKNLSKTELGALMMIFDLDGAKNIAYKIGMGKPLGLGSIEITPTLYVEDAQTYAELFNDNGWQNPFREKNPAEYLDEFKKYLATEDFSATWQNVMDDLKKILDWSPTTKKVWSQKIASMSGDPEKIDERFEQRVPLPTIKTIFEAVK